MLDDQSSIYAIVPANHDLLGHNRLGLAFSFKRRLVVERSIDFSMGERLHVHVEVLL